MAALSHTRAARAAHRLPRRHDLVLAALALALLEVGILPVLHGGHRFLPLVAAAAIAAVIPIAGARLRGRLDLLELGVTIAVAYVLLFPVRAVVLLSSADFGADGGALHAEQQTKQVALVVATLALTAGGLAYNSRAGAALGERVRLRPVRGIEHPGLLLTSALVAVGLAAEAMVFAVNTRPGFRALVGERPLGLLSAASAFLLIGLALATQRARTSRPRDAAFLLLCVVSAIALALAAQFKEGAVIAVLVPLVMLSEMGRRPIRLRWLAVAAILGLALFSAVTVARHAQVRLGTRSPSAIVHSFVDQATKYNWVNGAPRSYKPWMPLSDPLIVTTRRLYGYDTLVEAVRYTPSAIPYQDGKTLEPLAAGVVPRVLWPGKPSPNMGIWFEANYWGRYVPAGVGHVPQAVTPMAELWIDFGIAGSILGLAILGLWYRFAHVAFARRGSATSALVYSVIFVTVVDVTRDIPLAYVTLLQRLVVTGLFITALTLLPRLWPLRRPILSVGRRVRLRHALGAAKRAPDPRSVLDVGCGDGALARRIAYRNPDACVVGLDPDFWTILAGRRWAPGNLQFVEGEVPTAKLEGLFDLILCTDVLEHLEDDERAVRWLAEQLEPSGRLVLHVPAASQRHVSKRVADAMEAELAAGRGPHVREGYAPEDLALLLRRAGLEPLEISSTFHRGVARWAADLDTWTYLQRARLLKTLALPLILAAAALERRPSRNRRGNGVLAVARRP